MQRLNSENIKLSDFSIYEITYQVIAALGDQFLEDNLPGVIRITESGTTEPHIRDGYILLYIYLPMALGDRFIPFLSQIIPSILKVHFSYILFTFLKVIEILVTINRFIYYF